MTKADYFKRAVKELNLDTSDPFTLLFANACALLDQRDELKRDRERLVKHVKDLELFARNNTPIYHGSPFQQATAALLHELGEDA